MTVDVRCTIVTDRGISTTGSLSEDHIDTTNVLAKVRGSVTFAGILNLAHGSAVNVAYQVPGFDQVTRFPRRLRVISSKVDPYEEVTTAEVGCILTLKSDLKPPDAVFADGITPAWKAALPSNMATVLPNAIYARDVLADCLDKLGLTAAAGNVALRSAFLQSELDLSAGYVQVLNDLLASESCYGFVNAAEQFVVRKVLDVGGPAAVLTRDQLLTLESIEGGEKAGDQVRVVWDGAVQAPPGLELPDVPVLPALPEVTSILIDGVAPSVGQQAALDAAAQAIATAEGVSLTVAKGIVYDSIKAAGGTVTAGVLSATTAQFNAGISGAPARGVSYSTQRRVVDAYNQPSDTPGATQSLLNWTYEESVSPVQIFRQEYVTEAGASGVDIVSFAAKSISTTEFEDVAYVGLDGVIRNESVAVLRRTVTENRVGPINATRWKSKLSNGSPARAADPVTSISETRINYTPTQDGLRTLREVTEEWEPIIAFGGRLGIQNWVGIDLGLTSVLVSRTETTYDVAEVPVTGGSGALLGSFDRTKTTVRRWLAWGATQEGTHGAGALAKALEALDDAERIAGIYRLVENCLPLVFDGIETRISQGRGTVQSLPPAQDRARDRLGRDPLTGASRRTPRSVGLDFSGDDGPLATSTYRLPLPGDDIVEGEEIDPVTLRARIVKWNVEEQARIYGQMQSYLAFGHASGVAITTEIRNLPSEPLGEFFIDAAGVSGVFRANGTSWAWGGEGMIVGTDALLHGTAGVYEAPEFDDCWVPVPVAIEALPAAGSVTTNGSPQPANTIATPGGFDPVAPAGSLWTSLPTNGTDVPARVRTVAGVIEPRNERVQIRAVSRSRVIVQEYDYLLDLGTEEIRSVSVSRVELPTIVQLPVTTISLTPTAPLVYQPAEITLPVSTLTLTLQEPTVTGEDPFNYYANWADQNAPWTSDYLPDWWGN